MRLSPSRFVAFIAMTFVLISATLLSKERPAVETAYTQDGCTCVRGHVRDLDNKPIKAARVTLLVEQSLSPVGFAETDRKGNFFFRSVPLYEELMLAVEADGFQKVTVPGIKVPPSYSCVATIRLSKETPKP